MWTWRRFLAIRFQFYILYVQGRRESSLTLSHVQSQAVATKKIAIDTNSFIYDIMAYSRCWEREYESTSFSSMTS